MKFKIFAYKNQKKNHIKIWDGEGEIIGYIEIADKDLSGNTVGRRLRAAGFLDPKYTGNITYWIDEKGIEVNMKNSGKPVLFVSPAA